MTPFERLLEDVLREELAHMGLDYEEIVASIAAKREGEIYSVRFHGEAHDLDLVEPADLPSRAELAALLRRKLQTALSRGR